LGLAVVEVEVLAPAVVLAVAVMPEPMQGLLLLEAVQQALEQVVRMLAVQGLLEVLQV
jgi:hypothetical protein